MKYTFLCKDIETGMEYSRERIDGSVPKDTIRERKPIIRCSAITTDFLEINFNLELNDEEMERLDALLNDIHERNRKEIDKALSGANPSLKNYSIEQW